MKYLRSTTLGYKDIETRKSEFVAKTQLNNLNTCIILTWCGKNHYYILNFDYFILKNSYSNNQKTVEYMKTTSNNTEVYLMFFKQIVLLININLYVPHVHCTILSYNLSLLFNEITNLKFPPFLITGRIITCPPTLQGG